MCNILIYLISILINVYFINIVENNNLHVFIFNINNCLLYYKYNIIIDMNKILLIQNIECMDTLC